MLRILVLTAISLVGTPAYAQKVLEMFEGQNDLPESNHTIQVESLDANAQASSYDGESGTQVDGGITINFERDGTSILVPATVQGKPVYFMFDTGATTTTLSYAFAKSANILPARDNPVVTVQTANGPRQAQFGLMDRLVLGGRTHAGVTFTICNACPAGTYKGKPVVGLLGLNVINRYRISIDEGHGKIEMYPNTRFWNRSRDIEPWLEVDDYKSFPDGARNRDTSVTIKNRAPRAIAELSLGLECSDGRVIQLGKKSIPAKGSATFKKSIELKGCSGMKFQFDDHKW